MNFFQFVSPGKSPVVGDVSKSFGSRLCRQLGQVPNLKPANHFFLRFERRDVRGTPCEQRPTRCCYADPVSVRFVLGASSGVIRNRNIAVFWLRAPDDKPWLWKTELPVKFSKIRDLLRDAIHCNGKDQFRSLCCV